MIDINKKYRTRNGYEVRIYATGGEGDQAIHGAVFNGAEWQIYAWYNNGQYSRCEPNGKHDLIEVRPRHKRTVWLNVSDGHCWVYPSREKADASPSMLRIACIKVDLDFAEGDGL